MRWVRLTFSSFPGNETMTAPDPFSARYSGQFIHLGSWAIVKLVAALISVSIVAESSFDFVRLMWEGTAWMTTLVHGLFARIPST